MHSRIRFPNGSRSVAAFRTGAVYLRIAVFVLQIILAAGFAFALKIRPHPIQDLIEGDQKTPPEGEHIVEERALTPAYPLPNMSRFPQADALETFPIAPEDAQSKEAVSEFEDEWADWSSWDDWSDLDEWDTIESTETSGEASSESGVEISPSDPAVPAVPSGSPESAAASEADHAEDEFNWDTWLSEEDKP
ncbi:MAG: hypothetical protein HY587_00715 [Candidatus Omnitrophica bacterium]|nr:hypothetical protein [Candidatus Omnitrophota bacterium]